MPSADVTILNSMGGDELDAQLAYHRAKNLVWMDIKNQIYGHWTVDIPLDLAARAQAEIERSGQKVYCLSTSIFFDSIDKGLETFGHEQLGKIDHVIALAKVFKPKLIRMTAAQFLERDSENAVKSLQRKHGWVFDVYREAVDRFNEAGFRPTIENEVRQCFLAQTDEFLDFFDALDRRGKVGLTWDVQNQWSTGEFPTVAVYERLKPLIEYCHFKGGATAPGSQALAWNVALEEASWPVVEIARRVVADGVSPVICLNPPQHGQPRPNYDYEQVTGRDIDFLRSEVPGVN